MKSFQVYRHPTIEAQAVKVGFCWPAFFFGVIWMLISRLWGWAVLWVVLYVGLALLEAGIGEDAGLILIFLITTQAKRNLSSRSGIGGVLSAT